MGRGTRIVARARLSGLLAIALSLAASLITGRLRAEPNVPALAWQPPAELRVMRWAVGAQEAAVVREPSPSSALSLGRQELLVVPVDPGSRVRVSGGLVSAGLGSGHGSLPDTITWIRLDAPPRGTPPAQEIYVPPWSSARFLVLRTEAEGAKIFVEMASRESVPLRWHRFDKQLVDHFAGAPGETFPVAPAAEAEPLVRWLSAAEKALAGFPRGIAAAWLMARWLEESYRVRPVMAPYFATKGLPFTWGRGVKGLPEIDRASAWRALSPGSAARVEGPIDVLRVAFAARRRGRSKIIVREGDAVARVIEWTVPARANEPDGWTDPEWFRFVLPSATPKLSLEVVEGEVAIAMVAYRHQTDLLDAFAHRRDRGEWLERVIASGPEGLRGAARLTATRSAGALVELRGALPAAGAAGALRALLLGEAARSAPDASKALESSAEALTELSEAPPFVAGPLGRSILHHLEAIGAQGALGTVAASHEDDAQAVAASLAALSPPLGAPGPRQALSDERYARRHGEVPDAAARAHRTWAHETPWTVLDPAPGTAVRLLSRPVYSDLPGGLTCPTRGQYGLRWTRFVEPRTAITVSAPVGAHARVTLRGDLDDGDADASLRIDGQETTVHAASGLPSFLAIAPGEHVFERSSNAPPVLARIPREGAAPCALLREMERWAKVERTASFPVGGLKAWTVAQVVVTLPGAERAVRLKLDAGAGTYDVWVRSPASGRAEIPVSAAAAALAVETEHPLELRAYVRAPAPLPASVATVSRSPQGDLEQLFETIRGATRTLRTGPPLLHGAAHAERRSALEALGYHRLALFDAPSAPDLSERPEPREGPAEAVVLPAGSRSIEPLGYVSRIGPLPSSPGDPDALARARLRFGALDMEGAVMAIRPSAEGRADASTLLLAVAAERAGLPQLAADALERIGLTHRSGAALAHAATLAADAALERQDKAATLRAFVLAQIATELGDPASGAFGRLAPAVAWAYPSRAESSAGFASIEALAKTDDVALAVRVRRAWADAPDNATLLAEGNHIEVRLARQARGTISLTSRCDALDQAASACALVGVFDGEVVPCPSARPGEPARCTVSVPPGVHRLELRAPAEQEVMGWVIARDDAAGIDLPSRVVSDWVEIDPGRPLELAFAGPTVLRIDGRSEAGVERRLGVTVLRAQETVFREEWAISGERDDHAARMMRGGDRTNVTMAAEKRISVLSDGPHRLRIASPDGRVLLRLAVARATGLPRPRDGESAFSPSTTPGADEVFAAPMPPVVDDPTGFPVSVGATTLYVNTNLGHLDDAGQTRFSSIALSAYGEQQARLHREIAQNRAWVSMTVLGRVRDGPASWGFSPTFDASPAGYMPGIFASSLTVLQSKDGHTAIGGNVTGEVYGAIPLSGNVRFAPWGAFTINPVDSSVRAVKGADPDVYTLYDASHPRHASAGLRLAAKPYVDTIVKLQASTRSDPEVTGIDRVEGRFDIDTLPGEGLAPWLGFTWQVSYRPITAERPQAFVRDTFSARITFWSWLGQGHRLSFGGALNALFDVPKGSFTQPPLSGFLSLAYDETGVRGVRDFPTRLVPFRDRQEEHSGRIHRAASPAEPSWVGP